VRALYDESTITVYQAFSPAIADAALTADRFVPPFKLDRMTWIKPSFLWMMYRSGWATKPGQERILAIRMSREGFESALSQACLSHYEPAVYPDHDTWQQLKNHSPVRVQWDPERDINLNPLPWRTIQIGLTSTAIRDYVNHWVTHISDVTPPRRDSHTNSRVRTPTELAYPLPPRVARAINAQT
jgi:hypothetical protein